MSEVTQARLRAVAVAAPAFVMVFIVLADQLTGVIESSWILADMGQSVDLGAPGALADLSLSMWLSLLNVTRLSFELLAVLAICSYLRSAGEKLWSFLAVPLLTLRYVVLSAHDGWGLILSPLLVAGASTEAFVPPEGLATAPLAVFLTSMFVLWFPGWICLMVGIWRSHVLSRTMTWTVVLAVIAQGVPVPIPYWYPLMISLFFLPIAYKMWVDSAKLAVGGQAAEA